MVFNIFVSSNHIYIHFDSSFEHVLHSYGLHIVSTCKYEVNNYCFDSISYLWNNQLSSFQVRQNNMAHLNQCLLLNLFFLTMSHSKIKSKLSI